MWRRVGIALGLAVAFAGADLAVQSSVVADPALAHRRSVAWMVISVGLLAVALVSSALPSRLLAASLGVLGGGLAGNLGSAVLHHRVIPNPFVMTNPFAAGEVAFNPADTMVIAGLVLGAVAIMRLAIRYRDLLPEHTIPVRIARCIAARRAATR